VIRPCPEILTHYTGGGGSTTDGKSDAQHMADLAAYARGAGKEWEYNYVITAPLGWIWEMAGVYRAAHCQHMNERTVGIQMNLGVGAAPNQAMIDSHRWLREELKRTGQWTGQLNSPHYRYRATACCGRMMAEPPGARNTSSPSGEGSWGNLLPFMVAPYAPTPAPGVIIVTPQDEAKIRQIVREETPKVAIPTPWAAGGSTPLGEVLRYIVRNVGTLYNGDGTNPQNGKMAAQVDGLVDTVEGIDVSAMVPALQTAVRDAVVEALAANPVSANVTDEDVERIAEAVGTELFQRLQS
jgi:hypothetical protein